MKGLRFRWTTVFRVFLAQNTLARNVSDVRSSSIPVIPYVTRVIRQDNTSPRAGFHADLPDKRGGVRDVSTTVSVIWEGMSTRFSQRIAIFVGRTRPRLEAWFRENWLSRNRKFFLGGVSSYHPCDGVRLINIYLVSW